MTEKSRKSLSPASKSPASERNHRISDLGRAAHKVLIRVRELERTGDGLDSAVETALDELCLHLSDLPEGVGKPLLVTVLLRNSIRASVGIFGVSQTIEVLNAMTENLTGAGMTGRLN